MIIPPHHLKLVSRQRLEDFWIEQFDIFDFSPSAVRRLAKTQSALLQRLAVANGSHVLNPTTVVAQARHIDKLVAHCSDLAYPDTLVLGGYIEEQSAQAGHYWLALTGAFPGIVGVNDGIGKWFLRVAESYAAPEQRREYSAVSERFSDVRNYIEFTIRKAA